MIYKFYLSNDIKSFKVSVSNYYYYLIYNISNFIHKSIKNILPLNVVQKCNNISLLSDFVFFKTSDLNNKCSDDKLILSVLLQVKKANNKSFSFLYQLGEFPKISRFRDFVLNGIWKTFVYKMCSGKKGISFSNFIKDNTLVVYCRFIISKSLYLSCVIEENNYYLILKNYFKINLFSFLYYVGLNVKNILKYFKYSNSLCFKKSFISFNLAYTPREENNKICLSFIKKLFNFFSTGVSAEEFIINNINSFVYDLINIFNILDDIRYNKTNPIDIDLLGVKTLLDIKDYLLFHFKLFLKNNNNLIKNDLTSVISFIDNNNSCNQLEQLVEVKYKDFFDFREFLSVNPLVQYLDQTNSLSELNHKNKVVMYDSDAKYNIDIRNVKLNSLGFICPIDTSEGDNCGIVLSLAKNVRTTLDNKLNLSCLPLKNSKCRNFFNFYSPTQSEKVGLDFSKECFRKDKCFKTKSFQLIKNSLKLNLINSNVYQISPDNIFAYPESIIPFLFYNDPTRILMGSKMQTQSVPLCRSTRYFIYTTNESHISSYSPSVLKAVQEGVVIYVTNNKIIIRDIYNRRCIYPLIKYKKNNYSVISQKPIVWVGERVFAGQILTSSVDFIESEFNTGNNLLVSYGNFFGYNFEDSIVINNRVLYSNIFTSSDLIIIESFFKKKTFNNNYEIFSPLLSESNIYERRVLDTHGFVKEGSKLLEGDVIISKISVFKELFKDPKKFILSLLFGNILNLIQDNSIKSSLEEAGRVIKVEVYSTDITSFYLGVRVYIFNQKLISVGDKLCGFYGNKGVISYVGLNKDMMYTSCGLISDLITDSIGVPSRLNVGQLFENLFGIVCRYNNVRMSLNCNTYHEHKYYIKNILYNFYKKNVYLNNKKNYYNVYSPGKVKMRNGLNGTQIKEGSFIGLARYFKLIHMVQNKIHYRGIGPYTELIQQPMKGKEKMGGQRFGEMEVWALEAYGSSYTITELFSYKSDDIKARESILNTKDTKKGLFDDYKKEILENEEQNNTEEEEEIGNIISDDTYNIEEEENIIKEKTLSESFNLLIKELNNLTLNIESFIYVNNSSKAGKISTNKIYIE